MESGGMEAAVLAPAPVRAAPLQTDTELVAAVRRADDRAFEELYARYHRRISSYIFGMVKDHARAEDLTQEVFMSALRRMRDTDRAIAFKPWIYEIAKNACIDQFRRQRRAEEISYDAEEGLGAADYGRLVTGDPTPDVALDHKQQLDHLRGALGGLSEAHHQILVMREFEGLSYREIGERMNMSRPSVESTLFRARKRLTEEYDELVSGQRCERVQTIISSASGGGLGARDRRRMARHLSYCQPCRRHAYAAGLGDVVPVKTGVGAKIAAWLPLPIFLQRRLLGHGAGGRLSDTAGTIAHWSVNAASLEPAAGGWTKALVTAATVAVAGVGAGAVTSPAGSVLRSVGPSGITSLGSSDNGPSVSPVGERAGGAVPAASSSTTAAATKHAATTTTAATRTTSTTSDATKTTAKPESSTAPAAPAAGTQQAAAAKPKSSSSGQQTDLASSLGLGGSSGNGSSGGSDQSSAAPSGSPGLNTPKVSAPAGTPTVPADVTTVPSNAANAVGDTTKGATDAAGQTVTTVLGNLPGG